MTVLSVGNRFVLTAGSPTIGGGVTMFSVLTAESNYTSRIDGDEALYDETGRNE